MATKRKRKLSGAARASHLMKRGRKKLRKFVRSQANRPKRKRVSREAYEMERREAKFEKHLKSYTGGRRSKSRKTHGNPVRVGAQVVGSGTGWIKAKAVKVRKVKGKGYVVDVKR